MYLVIEPYTRLLIDLKYYPKGFKKSQKSNHAMIASLNFTGTIIMD